MIANQDQELDVDQMWVNHVLGFVLRQGSGFMYRRAWPELAEVAAWADAQQLRRAPETYLNAEQHFSNASYGGADFYGPLGALIDRVVGLIRAAATYPGLPLALDAWYPDEAVIQRYAEGCGISWHTDESANSYLLTVIMTLRGAARFLVEGDADRHVAASGGGIHAGDIVFLRGAGFVTDPELAVQGRPRHMVDDCRDDRLVVMLRMHPPAA